MVAVPEKELRFTRSGQAVGFCVAGAVLVAAGVTLVACAFYRHINPQLPHPLWALPFFLGAALLFWLAMRLTKHAYLILTPLGLEIFPFFRPARGMQMLMWQEIVEAEIDEGRSRLTLHFNADHTSGVHVSLAPVRSSLRPLLTKAVLGRVKSSDNSL